jgi:predicted hydrolase (HD superfamily)
MLRTMTRGYTHPAWLAAAILVLSPALLRPADPAFEKARAKGWEALQARVKDVPHRNHALAVEAMMRSMASPSDDADEWALAGLLHDIDINDTAGDMARHGLAGGQILHDLGFNDAIVHAVRGHDDRAGVPRTSGLDHALYCADQLYWLMRDAGAAFPSTGIASATPEALWSRMRQLPGKAGLVERVSAECAQIGITLPQALDAALAGMRSATRVTALADAENPVEVSRDRMKRAALGLEKVAPTQVRPCAKFGNHSPTRPPPLVR